MRKSSLLFFVIFISGLFYAQNTKLYYEGVFLNKKSKPELNLPVTNKSSGIVALTDSKGNLIIEAKNGDTLFWNKGKSELKVFQFQLRELRKILESRQKNKFAEEIVSKDYRYQVASSFHKKDSSTVSFSPFIVDQRSDFDKTDDRDQRPYY